MTPGKIMAWLASEGLRTDAVLRVTGARPPRTAVLGCCRCRWTFADIVDAGRSPGAPMRAEVDALLREER
jgi:hypothetical protein